MTIPSPEAADSADASENAPHPEIRTFRQMQDLRKRLGGCGVCVAQYRPDTVKDS